MARSIIYGITGGIAAYKSLDIIRKLRDLDLDIYPVLTENAKRFITEISLQTLSGNLVQSDMFNPDNSGIDHIELAQKADLFLVIPATANIIGKFANGIADDLMTTTFLSTTAQVVIAPAMNNNIYANSAVQDNLNTLKKRGVKIIEPAYGELACGSQGIGRLADSHIIINYIEDILVKKTDLHGKNILVTGGATREFIDSVRFITNNSSGKTGYYIAKEAQKRGGRVILISGQTVLPDPEGVEIHKITSSKEMYDKVVEFYTAADIVIMSAAVSDYTPINPLTGKLKKSKERLSIDFKRTVDILKYMGDNKGEKILVGFAAETDNLISNAGDKLMKKNLDLIIVNDVSNPDIGFGSDDNKISIINSDGRETGYPILQKSKIAHLVIDEIVSLIKDK